MNIEFFKSQDDDTKLKLISEFKNRRKLYLKRLRRLGVKVRNTPKEEMKKIILCIDKINDINKEITKCQNPKQ